MLPIVDKGQGFSVFYMVNISRIQGQAHFPKAFWVQIVNMNQVINVFHPTYFDFSFRPFIFKIYLKIFLYKFLGYV